MPDFNWPRLHLTIYTGKYGDDRYEFHLDSYNSQCAKEALPSTTITGHIYFQGEDLSVAHWLSQGWVIYGNSCMLM